MEQIEQTLTDLLEQEAEFLRICGDYLRDAREKPTKIQEYISGLVAVHYVRFDEIDAQLTRLENMAG